MSLVVLKLFIYCIALTLVLVIVVLLVDFCVSFACILFVYVCAWEFICVCFDWCLMLFGLVLVCVAVCCLLWIEVVWFVILFVLVESLIGDYYIVVGGCVMLRCCYLCNFVVVVFLFPVCGWFCFDYVLFEFLFVYCLIGLLCLVVLFWFDLLDGDFGCGLIIDCVASCLVLLLVAICCLIVLRISLLFVGNDLLFWFV